MTPPNKYRYPFANADRKVICFSKTRREYSAARGVSRVGDLITP